MRREGPIVVGFIVGALVVISNLFVTPFLRTVRKDLDQWYLIVVNWTVLVGMINLTQLHLKKISRKVEGWFYSLTLLAGIYVYLFYILFFCKSAGDPKFQWLYNTSVSPMSSTMFSLLAFYIASAAYRSFRIRTAEATVLLAAAVLVMLGRVPIGNMISPALPDIASWMISVPNTAGMRGIQLGAGLGGIATALRVLIGIERGHLGGE